MPNKGGKRQKTDPGLRRKCAQTGSECKTHDSVLSSTEKLAKPSSTDE